MSEIRGPYRENSDPNPESSIEKMENKITAEGKLSLRLDEKIHSGSILPNFVTHLESSSNGPKGIILYSLATGILRHTKTEDFKTSKTTNYTHYTYQNPNNPAVFLTVEVPKKRPIKSLLKKEVGPAKIVGLTTKEAAEAEAKERQNINQEATKERLSTRFRNNIRDTENLIRYNAEDNNEIVQKTYFEELEGLKESMEVNLDLIKAKLKERNKK